MLAADRRMGIVSILVACGHATARELAQEFGVSRRMIMHEETDGSGIKLSV